MTAVSIRRGALQHALAAGLLLLLATPSRANVLKMSIAAGPYHSLQAAIDAAADGDTILVDPAGCGFFCYDDLAIVDGKALAIVVDATAGPVNYQILVLRVRNLQAGQQVVLRGLKVDSTPPGTGYNDPAIQLSNNAGSVWIEDCVLTGDYGNGPGLVNCGTTESLPGKPALEVQGCASVTVVRTQLNGGPGANAFPPSGGGFSPFGVATDGGPAARLSGSQVALYECTLEGGKGGDGSLCGYRGNGGVGLDVLDSVVLLSGGLVHGGGPGDSGAGAVGVHGDATSMIETLDVDVAGGGAASAWDVAPSTLQAFTGKARSFRLNSPLREQQAGTLELEGLPGDFVGFLWSFDSGSLPLPAHKGWLVLDTGFLAGPFLIGTITAADGHLSLPFTAPALQPGLLSQTFLLQGFFKAAGAGTTLGSGTAFTLLDASL